MTILHKRGENQITNKLEIYNNEIETTKFAKLLGIEIDNQLSFKESCTLKLPCS